MKKRVSISIIITGAVLFIAGLFLQIPSKELTTYSLLEDEYTVIEEYVGGDAYNYIIGASLVGGEIAGAKTQKAIFLSMGLMITCLGLYALSRSEENNTNEKETVLSEIKNCAEETVSSEEETVSNSEEIIIDNDLSDSEA